MNELMANLDALNRKERYFVFTQATGNEDFRLGTDFIAALSTAIGVTVPADAKAYIDYHLDWLHASVYIANHPGGGPNYPNGASVKPGELRIEGTPPRVSTGTQEDLDLLVVFEREGTTWIVMVEAKGETGWTNKQLDSKAERLNEIFGTNLIDDNAPIRPVFCLWSPKQSFGLIPDAWPAWMLRPSDARSVHDIAWMRLDVPSGRKKVTGVDRSGRNSMKRPYWVLERVRPEEIAE